MFRHIYLWIIGHHKYLLPLNQPSAQPHTRSVFWSRRTPDTAPFDQDAYCPPVTTALERLSAQVIARAEEILQEADAE
jgi:hypothetical protein